MVNIAVVEAALEPLCLCSLLKQVRKDQCEVGGACEARKPGRKVESISAANLPHSDPWHGLDAFRQNSITTTPSPNHQRQPHRISPGSPRFRQFRSPKTREDSLGRVDACDSRRRSHTRRAADNRHHYQRTACITTIDAHHASTGAVVIEARGAEFECAKARKRISRRGRAVLIGEVADTCSSERE